MKTPTSLDAIFPYLETPEMPMHVGSLNLCELSTGFLGSLHKAGQQLMARRMHLGASVRPQAGCMPFCLGHPLRENAEEDAILAAFRPLNRDMGDARFEIVPL